MLTGKMKELTIMRFSTCSLGKPRVLKVKLGRYFCETILGRIPLAVSFVFLQDWMKFLHISHRSTFLIRIFNISGKLSQLFADTNSFYFLKTLQNFDAPL